MKNIKKSSPVKYEALDIAKYFIWKSAEEKKPITNKKLQKLVYYAQAWYLVASKGSKSLFDEKIDAWIHGPVVSSVYHAYKQFGFHEIDSKLGDENNFEPNVKQLLDEVWDVYGKLDANALEALTHSESPWQEARSMLDQNEFGDAEISNSNIFEYYSKLKKKLEDSNKNFPFSELT